MSGCEGVFRGLVAILPNSARACHSLRQQVYHTGGELQPLHLLCKLRSPCYTVIGRGWFP